MADLDYPVIVRESPWSAQIDLSEKMSIEPNTDTPLIALGDEGMAEFPYERQLVLLAQSDDREALEGLLIRLQNSSSRYVRGLVGEPDSEDVLQDVFVKIWRNVKSLEMPELFRPWAYRIASRTALSPNCRSAALLSIWITQTYLR